MTRSGHAYAALVFAASPLLTSVVPHLGEHATGWDALVDDSSVPSPFLRSWWLGNAEPKTCSHLLFHGTDGTLVGGVPLVLDRVAGVPRLRFSTAGVLCPDHLDLVARTGAEEIVGTGFMKWVTSLGRNLVIDLTGLVHLSLLSHTLARAGEAPGEILDVAPYAALPAAPATYLETRSSGTRRSVRRTDRRLSAAGARHHRVEPSGLANALEDFRRLHAAREDRAPLLAALPLLARAVAAGMAAGEARVDVLETGGRTQAVSIAFVVAGRISLYQVARSLAREDDGAGTALLHRVVEDAVLAGCHEVDLLRGDEGYKASLADDRRSIGRIRTARGPVAGALLAAGSEAARLRRRLDRSA